jgi:hypothetical protein
LARPLLGFAAHYGTALAPAFEALRHNYRTILRKNSEFIRAASGVQSNPLNELLTGITQNSTARRRAPRRPPLYAAQSAVATPSLGRRSPRPIALDSALILGTAARASRAAT